MTDEVKYPTVHLRQGGDRRLSGGHPWAFANEIKMDAVAKALEPGSLVALCRVDGKPLAIGTFNPHALICFRAYLTDPRATLDGAWFRDRIAGAVTLREKFFDSPHYRLIHAEADGLPGLVCDRFGDTVVLQSGTAGMDALLPLVVDALNAVIAPQTIIVHSDSGARRQEGLDADTRAIKGLIDQPLQIIEGELKFVSDLMSGQKTGWFYDQRFNRTFAGRLCGGARVLDLYCYAGAFAVRAAAAGATAVTAIDRAEAALELGRQSAKLNNVEAICQFEKAEVFKALEARGAKNQTFDIVHCDPPAFVKSKKDLKPGVRGYRKLARGAAHLVAPGGFLVLSSCSHHVDMLTLLGEAGRGIDRAGRTARLVHQSGAGPDHPIHPQLPESAYLKCLVFALD